MTDNRWIILFVLFLARTAMGFQFQSVAAVAPVMVPALGIDLMVLGTLVGFFMLPGIVLAVPSGALGARFGGRTVTGIGLAAMAIGGFLVAAAETDAGSGVGLALTGRAISGAGAVLLNVQVTKMAADWFADKELNTAMGLLVTSWPIGIGLALVILGPVADTASWGQAIAITAWVSLAALICLVVFYRPPPDHAAGLQQSARAMLDRREVALVSAAGLVWALYNTGYILVVSFVPTLLAEAGRSVAGAGAVTSAATWAIIPSIILGGILVDRIGHGLAVIAVSLLAMAAALPLILIVASPLTMIILVGVIAGPPAGAIMALPARGLRPQARNLGMGIYFTWYYVAMAVLPPVAGWTRDATGIAAAPLWFGGALLLAAVAALGLFRAVETARPAPSSPDRSSSSTG